MFVITENIIKHPVHNIIFKDQRNAICQTSQGWDWEKETLIYCMSMRLL